MSGRRLSVRDYKGARRANLSSAWLRPFALGLALGLAIAAAVFIESRHHLAQATDASALVTQGAGDEAQGSRTAGKGRDSDASRPGAAPQGGSSGDGGNSAAGRNGAGSAGSVASSATATAAGAALPKYDFYQMLPRSQVLIPARESEAHLPASAPVDRPGTYFLQIGSYRDAAVADRVRAQVQKLGVTASVQRIVVDAATWHRVRVGPIRDLAVLNRVRHQLQAGNLAAMIVRVNP